MHLTKCRCSTKDIQNTLINLNETLTLNNNEDFKTYYLKNQSLKLCIIFREHLVVKNVTKIINFLKQTYKYTLCVELFLIPPKILLHLTPN